MAKLGTTNGDPQPGGNGVAHLATEPILVLTRFRVRHPHHLFESYQDYQRVVRAAEKTRGVLKSVFLLENVTTFYSLSIWADEVAIPRFGTTVVEHVDAGRRVFGRLRFDRATGPEIWSGKWRLHSLGYNQRWPGLDLPTEADTASTDGEAVASG